MRGMKTRYVIDSPEESLRIREFGYEDVGEKAKWGYGRRNYYIIHFVLEGKGVFNGQPVCGNKGFLIRPMESVAYQPDPQEPWNYFWVSFEGDSAEQICRRYIGADATGIFSYSFRSVLTELIGTLFVKGPSMSNLQALSLFYSVISQCEELQPNNRNRHVEEAKNYIHLNFHRPLTVREIAETHNLDDRYLYNLFVRHEGISPKQYLNKVRIQNAKALLRQSDCTVTEVAFSVGFDDVLTFSRFFAKHTGISPRAFRKNKSSI